MSRSFNSNSIDLHDVVKPTLNSTSARTAYFVSRIDSLETEFDQVAFVVESLTHEIVFRP
jgi:hypothetical protein